MPQTAGAGMTLVASSRPPRPTSTMQASAGCAREGEEGGGGGRLEEADLHARRAASSVSSSNAASQFVLDQLAGEADALVEADQMRAGVDVGLEAGRLDRRAQEGAGRALAVGPGDMEDRRQRAARDCRAGRAARRSAPARAMSAPARAGQPVELALDGGIAETARSAASLAMGTGTADDRRGLALSASPLRHPLPLPRAGRGPVTPPPCAASDRRSAAPAGARRSLRWTTMSTMP